MAVSKEVHEFSTQKSYDHIKIKKLTLRQITDATMLMDEYYEQNTIMLTYSQVITAEVRREIIAEVGWQSSEFSAKSESEVLKAMLVSVQPGDRITCYKMLIANCDDIESRFPRGHYPTKTYVRPMYTAVLGLRSQWATMLSLLYKTAPTNVPLLDYKDPKSLIRNWIELFGDYQEYAKSTLYSLNTVHFEDVDEFLDKFVAKVKEQNDNAKSTKATPLPTGKPKESQKLSYLIQDTDYASAKSTHEGDIADVYEVESDSQNFVVSNASDGSSEELDDNESIVNELNELQGKPTKQLPCLAMVRRDKCGNGQRCKFSHDPLIIRNERLSTIKDINEFLATNRQPDNSFKPSGIPRRVVDRGK